MQARAVKALRALGGIVREYGPGVGRRKEEALAVLEGASLRSAKALLLLHESLCFLRAHPDDGRVLARVERMLAGFEGRADLRRLRRELADSGIAGTDIHFSFFQPQASWLARRYGRALRVDWRSYEAKERLGPWLEAFLLECEVPALYDAGLSVEAWVKRMARAGESDAQLLLRSIEGLTDRAALRRAVFDGLEIPFVIDGRLGGPSRTQAKHAGSAVVFQTTPLERGRPSLAHAIRKPPRAVRELPPAEARVLIELAREAMATRTRDLDSFSYASEEDVRMVDLGEGLELACMGLVPEQRIVVEALYAFLILRNGVPTGYALASALYRSSDIAYNVFETFRNAEAAHVFGRLLAAVRALLRSDTFCITPYQLGHGNAEGLASGAWWFYYKLGFRPRDARTQRLVSEELERMRRDPRHRSSRARLQQLSAEHLFWSAGKERHDVIGEIPLARIALAASELVSRRFGSQRALAPAELAEEAARRLSLHNLERWPLHERGAFERWSPLLLALPELERWPAADKGALAFVVRAKGGRRESDYLELFDRHPRLKRALLQLGSAG